MNNHNDIFSNEFFSFISNFADTNPLELRLKMHGKEPDFDINDAICQIECRRKCRKKLSRFIQNEHFLFPSAIAAEQASHQAVGAYHAELISNGDNVLDMTAGLGIDSLSMSIKAASVKSCELDPHKAEILAHNSLALGCNNIEVITGDSVEFLKNSQDSYDVVFIDPARRGNDSSRLYNLHDCQPDVTTILPLILKRSQRLLIKASPLLDVSQTLRDIPEASAIKAVSVDGECKELLIEINTDSDSDMVSFEAINLDREGETISNFRFVRSKDMEVSSESHNDSKYSDSGNKGIVYASADDMKPGAFLYEPDASVMKLMPWNEIVEQFPDLKKMGKSTHLFISDSYYEAFPGRRLSIKVIPDKAGIKKLKGERANVCVRNYPIPAEQLRKKIGLKEGKEIFMYGFRLSDTPMIVTAKII